MNQFVPYEFETTQSDLDNMEHESVFMKQAEAVSMRNPPFRTLEHYK